MATNYNRPGVVTDHQKNAVLAWWKKVTAANPKAENFKRLQVPVVDKGVFGIPLSESIKYSYSTISYMDDDTNEQCYGVIPTIIAKCGSFLKEEGLFVEGIFRLSGSAKRIGMLQTFFDTSPHYGSQLDWRGYTVHDAANILRRFLNYLPEPVIPHQFYHSFRELIDDESLTDDDALIDAFQKLIERLPLPNQFLLLYILDMLSLFALHSKSHRMDASNLAAVFAPGILSHPDHQMSPAQYKKSQRVLEFLINHQGSFTMPPACVLDNQFIPNASRRLFTASAPTNPNPPPQPMTDSPSGSIPSSPQSKTTNLPLSPIETLNVLVGPLPSSLVDQLPGTLPPSNSSSDKAHRPSTIAAESPRRPERSITMFEHDTFEHDPFDQITAIGVSRPATLKRSQTLPSKRQKYGENEPTQVVHVGRQGSQARRPEGWKHIKRVASERRSGDGPDVYAATPETLPTTKVDTANASPPTKAEHLTADGKIPPVTAGQKFLWDVSLEEEDEEVKTTTTPAAPKSSTTETIVTAPNNASANNSVNGESNVPNNQEGRSSQDSASSPDAAVPYSPQPMDESKPISPDLNARETAKITSPVDDTTKSARTSTDSESGGNGGFKAAMRRGTIGKLLAKSGHGNRRSSKDEPAAAAAATATATAATTTDEPEPRTSNA
ncbi:hypothetical protein INT43_000303 [Umbelopsis isabellina]|uniref:Rho-GAP domain-containing protein n=1 Tax=Mortierella isabellina TaxID=91625 RepID=A0A8H7Q0Z1_MORIS|nr:hypothetical protein INT43_000303 [Umbelopsis isabellina]